MTLDAALALARAVAPCALLGAAVAAPWLTNIGW